MSLRNFVRIVPVLALGASLVILPVAASATDTGGSIDPNGAGMSIDPDGVAADTGGSIDPNG